MRIELDRDRCEGHGMCEATAPDYFSVDDDGNLTVLATEVSDGDEAVLESAVLACPVAALRLQ
ncbi:ferredoxin [[Mycobacterium] burgundiense]|uniref:Ferredoxin n=1 Tax=[Mycobacterium] burgundiense TaxID=3064286 RepID=A0ABN9NSJ6_9MYCO|nr:ferredoxin [Mycolicibacterium sp. MU0053]CAJ1509980.1 ferredoxin [Mycolicibacterium sp. MU0053]